MKLKLIYPKWPKMPNQPEFHLPPHGPTCFAADVPDDVEISFCDEHVQTLDMNEDVDFVAISTMLTCQIPRGWEIADIYRARGVPVIFGGIAAMLHSEETQEHSDSVFVGEIEGRFNQVLQDLKKGELKKVYDYSLNFPDMSLVGSARRDILDRELYNFRGMQMVDLIHASRGCRFNCFPCCTPYLGGCQFRPRDIDSVIREIEGIDNNRLFFVDNSMAQDDKWEKELFKAIAPLKKKWISHPIKNRPEILDLAAEAGCWYVYQAIIDTSEVIRDRIKGLKDRGIGVEGTIILGMDNHDEDYIKRLVDYLLEIDLDLAEFTILTPFPHTPIRAQLEKENRILHNDWIHYTGAETVFQPAKMSADKLTELHQYAWDTFYRDDGKETRMAKLFMKVIEKEVADGTYKSPGPRRRKKWGARAGSAGNVR
ncbi:MAG: radical SAM protein [Kiritimatiellae bacterium]|nr:radical SAM protein [Kiritimatiellia bacterium]